MAHQTPNTDKDTKAFFDEIEQDEKNDYATCSVSQSFDAVYQCYTLGTQAIHYYRYGTKKDCSDRWEDFTFCLSTKTKSAAAADALIRQRQKAKEAKANIQRSSEEVWKVRQ